MVIIKEIDISGLAKILAIANGTAGFIYGMFTTMAAFSGYLPGEGIFSILLGQWSIVMLPVFYGVSGYLIGLIAGYIYNKTVGSKGFEVKTK
ncbi:MULTISPECIES: hypothetical protein [Methanohalobium]|uniref:Uncharacterized protein n=1 Tax=Methanohalobium evestigatum (strain ATCC BAA-1072 / DSM 3721 / NBRC 107634 / OCM 161 / Z-7303) TaxID=644295 RepID=D7E7B8_METEZ|nr:MULTISPECIES: hypothetical protein [Methanohalobium]ADI73867.1 conserved hypothetical protein [Methanohalobium evestigatum Z-7303]